MMSTDLPTRGAEPQPAGPDLPPDLPPGATQAGPHQPLDVVMAKAGTDDAAEIIGTILGGPAIFQAVRAFVSLKIADFMTGPPIRPDRLAALAGVDAALLERVLRVLAAHQVVTLSEQGTYALAPAGARLLRGRVDSLAHRVLLLGEEPWWQALADLPTTVATGTAPVVTQHGDLYGLLHTFPNFQPLFDTAMTRSIHPAARALAANAELWTGGTTVVDLAGGTGTVLTEVLRDHPHLTGTLMETPQVAAEARAAIAAAGMNSRITVVEGDLLTPPLPTGHTTILARALHTRHDPQALSILTAVALAMPERGRLLVIEYLIPPGIRRGPALPMDLTMMAMSPGRERSSVDFQRLLAQAGLDLARVEQLPAGLHLLVAAKPGTQHTT